MLIPLQIADVKLKCSLCETELGVVDGDSKMWKINKWNLRLNDQEKETTYPLECFLSSQIISHAEEGGVRRLLVTSEADVDTQANGIKVRGPQLSPLWVLSTNRPMFRYGFSILITDIPTRTLPSQSGQSSSSGRLWNLGRRYQQIH